MGDLASKGGSQLRQSRPYEPKPLLRWLYRRFFRHIHVDEAWSEGVREASKRGVVVYVMRSLSFLDFLCLDYLLKKVGLPLIRFVNDLGLWILEPFGKGGRRLRLRRQIPEEEALSSVLQGGFSALLFLRRPPRLGRPRRRGERLKVDHFRILVETQRRSSKRILLVPQTLVWSKLPPRHRRGLLDWIFGPAEWPGKIRVLLQFILNFRNALLRSGEPFDLADFLDKHPHLDDAEAADKVRYALLRRIERERTLVMGPLQKTPARIHEELLRSPRVRKLIEADARASNKKIEKVEAEARGELRKLCAAQHPYLLVWLHRFLDWLWHRIFDGLSIDREGLERLRAAGREGALILIPSHKSHLDYLILSDVLYRNALSPPLIAAGDNLSFWPLGPLLRRGGAFFIRRSFQGKKLYAGLVDAYMRKLLVEGFTLEFFIEGGRSRTGKLLTPKFGLLSMLVDAALLLRNRKVRFVPISIGYERIIEQKAYVEELSGGDKQKENIGGLLRTPAILRSRYGRLYVQFGEIIDLEQEKAGVLGSALEDAGAAALSPKQRRALVQRIGHRVVYEISQATIATPASIVAMALLDHSRRGLSHQSLHETCKILLAALQRFGARIAAVALDEQGELRDDALREAIALFLDGKLITKHETEEDPIYEPVSDRRLALEYYKNTIIHFFVPSAMVFSALALQPSRSATRAALRAQVERFSKMFKYEFMYRADATFDSILDDTLAAMIRQGELETGENDEIRISRGAPCDLIRCQAFVLRSYFETYWLALRALHLVQQAPMSRKEWLRKTLALGRRLFLAGDLSLAEALSRQKIENALQSLRDQGLLRIGSDDEIILAADAMEQLPRMEDELRPFLRLGES